MRIRKARLELQAPPVVKTRIRLAVTWVGKRLYGIVCEMENPMRPDSVA